MTKLRLAALLAAGVALMAPALAQQTPPASPEALQQQLAKVFAEDQLSIEKCGTPRNYADDYRPTPMRPDQTRAPRVNNKQAFKVEIAATGLANPYALAPLPDGAMLVSIRAGGIRLISHGVVSEPLIGSPVIAGSARLGGMQDIAVDRDFAKNRTLYLTWSTRPEGAAANVGTIASAKLSEDGKRLTDIKVLKQGAIQPRRVAQAKDGTLFILTADIVTPYVLAQSVASPQGKVLRINTDGSIPKDNPFVNEPGADPSVYALGVRDPQSIAFHPVTGEPWVIENEPRGGDELNLIKPGKNYGFPLISYGRDNDGKLLNGGKTQQDGLEQPVYFWTPSFAPSGMIFYSGDKLPGWKNSIFAGGLSGQQLVRLELGPNGRVIGEEKLLRDRCKRIRDVRQGADGLIYVITDDPAGEVLRLAPQ